MNSDDIIARLRENEAALRAQGVAHAALFGSRARGDNSSDSDIDIIVEIASDVGMDLFQYLGIVHSIEDLFPMPVDVANAFSLKPHVRPAARRDAIYAF